MPEPYDLTKLDPNSFEHLVNMLALRVLGAGHTGFGPGADGGRDGYFEGQAPYPSSTNQWTGQWYIQSKFHKPHLSKDPQKWLIEQVKTELKEFTKTDSKRIWPDNWIVATNVDPSGAPATGAFDECKRAVTEARPQLESHFHIWGGSKILQLLAMHSEVADYYAEFLTPGQVLTSLYNLAKEQRASVDTVIRYLLVRQFTDQRYTKLDQAGSDSDTRPGIHEVFIDLPFRSNEYNLESFAMQYLVHTAGRNHRIDIKQPDTKEWRLWQRYPSRARVWFVRGGPGQGKSTIGQYYCQIQRAAFILQEDGPRTTHAVRTIAEELRTSAEESGFWSASPRIPINVELKEYAQWVGTRKQNEPRGVLTYLAQKIGMGVEQEVLVGTLKRALQVGGWFALFDGLDEVPHDVKDVVASEVCHFVDDIVSENNCDLLTLCTSRPQGYSGQFSALDGPTIDLLYLNPSQALVCAKPVLEFRRTPSEAEKSLRTLRAAIESSSVKELMTTPLQSHIMAIVIRDGGRPPDRRWQLFTNFYEVIRRREANKALPDSVLGKLLREDKQLLKTVHNRLGFILQARAETSEGAQTSLTRDEFKDLVKQVVALMKDRDVESTIDILMEATTARLVLVSTPDDGNSVRFDIRQLQEFFAAEFLYESVDADELRQRMEVVGSDSHWREVVHFLLSALIENNRKTELAVAVTILEQINEGNDLNERLLDRRLAVGALLAARLLNEGVLEQDKRIRQKFRKTIEPLTAFTDRSALLPLLNVDQPESKEWLMVLLVDVLRELNWSENCGAALILKENLRDGDDRIGQVCDILMAAPSCYLDFLFREDRRSILSFRTYRSKWVGDLALQLLLSPKWLSLRSETLSSLVQLLWRENSPKIDLNLLSQEEIILLQQFRPKPESSPKSADIDCGFIQVSFFNADWTTGTSGRLPNVSTFPRGFLEFVYQVLKFSEERTRENLISALKVIAPNFKLLESLPDEMQALLPLDQNLDLQQQCNELIKITSDEFDSLMTYGTIGNRNVARPLDLYRLGMGDDVNQWICLLNHYPQFAPRLWTDELWFPLRNIQRPVSLDTPEFLNPFIDKVLQYPRLLLWIVPDWGRLFANSPEREKEIRNALRSLNAQPRDIGTFYPSSGRFYGFRIDLPNEASVLPHVADALYWWISMGEYKHQVAFAPISKSELSHKVAELVGDGSSLIEIIELSSYPSTIRASALLLYLLRHWESGLERYDEKTLTNVYDAHSGEWFFDAFTTYAELIWPKFSTPARLIIGELLNLGRTNFIGRMRMDRLLRKWREFSSGPIQTARVQESWMQT